jgi:large subunit ribosomal protein L6
MKSRESLEEWVWRSFPLREAFYRGAKQESKRLAANCWPTSGDDLRCNDLLDHKLMSRIGNKAVEIPDKVKVNVGDGGQVSVEGPKGKLQWTLPREIKASVQDNRVSLAREAETRSAKALHGLSRSLVHNMVQGVSEGFTKKLEIEGVGFRAAVQGSNLNLSLGFSHPVAFPIPKDIKITVADNTKLTIEGVDKQLVGQVAADIRGFYPPEPYKGKGVRYAGEQIRRKVGKTVQ